MNIPTSCTLCPRYCQCNRTCSSGLCGGGSQVKVARAAPHFWEEPCISGTHGSGTVFFSGCSLGCVFCQNTEISHQLKGQQFTIPQLANLYLTLAEKKVHNINLVTPTHYWPWIQESLALAKSQGLNLPIVWNTSGYETVEAIESLASCVDIWLADLKFHSSSLSYRVAKASDYFLVASAALKSICHQTGPLKYNATGILQQGTIIRILVLPGQYKDAIALLNWIAESISPECFALSILRQYTPPEGVLLSPPFSRKLSSYEYQKVLDAALKLGFTNALTQDRDSANQAFTPLFDYTGLL